MKSAFRLSYRSFWLYLLAMAFILSDPRECFAQNAPAPAPTPAQGQSGSFEFQIKTGYSQIATPAPGGGSGALPGPGAQSDTLSSKAPPSASPVPQAGASLGAAPQAAVVPGAQSGAVTWSESLVRTAPAGAPVEIRLVGPNMVVLVQVVPFERKDLLLDLVVQGQVWLKMPDNSIAYQTTLKTLVLEPGGTLFFYPLGVDARGAAPVTVAIRVIRIAK